MKRVLRNRAHAAQDISSRRGSFGINFNEMCDELAQNRMEIMLASTADSTNGVGYDGRSDIADEKAQG